MNGSPISKKKVQIPHAEFSKRGYFLKDETIKAIRNADQTARELKEMHPDAPKYAPRLQVKITGDTKAALELASLIQLATAPQSTGIMKCFTDKKTRDTYTGHAVMVYMNYGQGKGK